MIVHFLDVSFALPSGWGLNTPIQGSPQEGCLQAAEPSPDTPSWFGCAGVWVRPSTGDPTQLSGPSGDPGQFWFMSTGVLPCPYPSSPPGDVVGTPGTLVDHGDRTVGGVLYRWYEWSDTCSLDTTPGTPVTFDAQVWWLPSAGIAFSDVVRHPEVIGILGSVRVDLSATGSETTTTTTINPDITHPTSGVEFRSPTANIHCEINYGPPYPRNLAFCFTAVPPQSATLSDAGTYSTCAGPTCVANPGLGEIELPYGQQISLGPFLCTSSTGGMTCTASGKGFEISRSGVAPA